MTGWKGKTRGGSFGYLFFITLIKRCGITTAYIFLGLVVPYFVPFAPKATKSIWFYARNILKLSVTNSALMLIRNYYSFGQILIDKLALKAGMQDKYNFRFENHPEFLNVLNSQQGVIIIGAHMGSWEAGVPYFEDYGKKINVVLYDAEYQKIKNILQKNTSADCTSHKFIPISNDGLSHVLSIKEALDEGEYVCFQGDRYIHQERTIKKRFMGGEALFPAGPFLLASRLSLPVVFYFAMREGNKTYHFHFTIAKQVTPEKGIKREEILLEQYITTLESIVKQYPTQWFNYYNFWKKH